jgi:hypothetical protein
MRNPLRVQLKTLLNYRKLSIATAYDRSICKRMEKQDVVVTIFNQINMKIKQQDVEQLAYG